MPPRVLALWGQPKPCGGNNQEVGYVGLKMSRDNQAIYV